MAKFLKHLNLQICKYWYIVCSAVRSNRNSYESTNWKPTNSRNPSNWAFSQITYKNLKN